MTFINICETTPYVSTPCSKYMIKIFGIINYLKIYVTPETFPLIVIKPLDVVLVPDKGMKIKILICYWRWIFLWNRWWYFDDDLLEGSDLADNISHMYHPQKPSISRYLTSFTRRYIVPEAKANGSGVEGRGGIRYR